MSTTAPRVRGAVLGWLLGVLAAAALAAALTYLFYCPCERIPGGWLMGEEITEPVSDWSMANEVGLCQVQVSAGLPHSINLNCMADQGKLYLSCANCAGKRWSTAALENPSARIRIARHVYPVRLSRVTDPALLDAAWQARAVKLQRGADTARPDHWWSFRVESR